MNMDITIYNIINLFISVLTAIGTCGATIIALWFGLRDRKPKLSVNCIQSNQTYGSIPGIKDNYFVINITNIGLIPVNITSVSIRSYETIPLYKKYFSRKKPLKSTLLLLPSNTFSSRLPSTLNNGDTALFANPWDTTISEIFNNIINKNQDINHLDIYVTVITSIIEKDFNIRKDTLNDIRKDLTKRRSH